MTTVEEAEALVAKMTRGEKAQLLQHIARDLGDAYPGIDVIEACPVATRASLAREFQSGPLEQARRSGANEAELLRSFAGLRAEDLANAWAYVRAHREQIDVQIQENDAA